MPGNVRGLTEAPRDEKLQQGELVLKDTAASHLLKIVAHHEYPIPDSSYALLGCDRMSFSGDVWVVGRLREDGRFEKLSVFRSADDEQVKLRDLVLEKSKIRLC